VQDDSRRLLALLVLLAGGCGSIRFSDDTPPSGDSGVFDDDDDDPGPAEDCCRAHDGADCRNPVLSTCVCEVDPSCCEDVWDEHCAAQVELLGCGVCGPLGDCCEERSGSGCEVPTVQTCVCEFDPACCAEQWDAQCVADVFLFGCGTCPGTSSCCVADGEPGCDDAQVQACVCADDPGCCVEDWDFQCIQEVEAFGCGVCSASDSSG